MLIKTSIGVVIGIAAFGLLFYWQRTYKRKTNQLQVAKGYDMARFGIKVRKQEQMQTLSARHNVRSLSDIGIHLNKQKKRETLVLPSRVQSNYILLPKALSWLNAFAAYTGGTHLQRVYYKASGNQLEVSLDKISDKWVDVPTYPSEQSVFIGGILIAYE